MFKIKTYLILAGCFCFVKISYGQSTYKQWLNKQNDAYNQFLSKQDSEFVGFLKKNWIKVKVEKGTHNFHNPKPQNPIVKTTPNKPQKPIQYPIKKQPPLGKSHKTVPEKKKNNGQKPPNSRKNTRSHNANNPLIHKKIKRPKNISGSFNHEINYYGSNLPVIYDRSLDVSFDGKITNKSIADYWYNISKSKYSVSLNRALSLDKNMELNGWGYAKLLFDIGSRVTNGNRNAAYLFTWFMLVKSGYQARVGYENNQIYLLISTPNKLYSTPYFILHDPVGKFYVMILSHNEPEPTGQMYTYKGSYPKHLNDLDLGFNRLPDLGNTIGEKTIHFSFKGKKYSLPVEFNKKLIDFYHYYPHTNLSVYFKSGLSSDAKNTLLPELNKIIKNKTQTEKANFLLHFVQYATGYETDQKQFGWEKPFFPEESLYYPYSDCEDRAVFYTYLIKNLMHLKVLGLKYPDHVTTAIRFTVPIKGDYIRYHGHKYYICDPTYINSSIGESMPKFRNVSAEIVYAN